MGMQLVNAADNTFDFSVISWYKVLNLARICGWVPAGTTAPEDWDCEDEVWDGRYHTNYGQWVSTVDALGIAAALQAGLDDIPDVEVGEQPMPIKRLTEPNGDTLELFAGDPMVEMNRRLTQSPIEYFSGPKGKALIGEFAEFCGEGGFNIW